MILAAVLSVLMAKVYADMYTEMRQKGLEAVGGLVHEGRGRGARA